MLNRVLENRVAVLKKTCDHDGEHASLHESFCAFHTQCLTVCIGFPSSVHFYFTSMKESVDLQPAMKVLIRRPMTGHSLCSLSIYWYLYGIYGYNMVSPAELCAGIKCASPNRSCQLNISELPQKTWCVNRLFNYKSAEIFLKVGI